MKKNNLEKVVIEDLFNFKSISNLTYSPNGEVLAFDVISADKEKNEYRSNVWLYRNNKASQLTFNLDANVICFLDDENLLLNRRNKDAKPGMSEVYKININGGEAASWLKLPFPLSRIKKVNDNLFVATGSIDANEPDLYLASPDKQKEYFENKKKDNDYIIVDEVPYWFNGAGVINKYREALFTIELGKEVKVKRITAPLFSVDDLLVVGNKVYFCGINTENKIKLFNKVYVYDCLSNKLKTLYNKEKYSFGGLFVLNKEIYLQASDGKEYGINQTADIYKLNEGRIEKVYQPEVTLYSSAVGDTNAGHGKNSDSNGKNFVTLATVDDHNEIFSFDNKFKKKVLFNKPGLISCLAVSKDKVAFVYQDSKSLVEVYEMKVDGSNYKKITEINKEALKDKYIAQPKRINYKDNGYDLHGWVLLPENFDSKKKYPAILDVHGGPRCIYTEAYFHEMQVWVSKGYVVMFTNIVGSDGRGDAFADIRGKYGYTDFENLMAFVDAVLKKYPNIDQKRLCETGGSYGGFMTNWIVTHTDRFCCAASQRSISNWISMSFISDIGLYFGIDQCGGKDVYSESDILWEHSPLKYAKDCKTPTLFIHSDEDYRCPLAEGMQMMQALTYNDVETRMVIFKGENHELSRSGKPLHREKRLAEITNWFDKHCGGKK